jgi:hypothetical protein
MQTTNEKKIILRIISPVTRTNVIIKNLKKYNINIYNYRNL